MLLFYQKTLSSFLMVFNHHSLMSLIIFFSKFLCRTILWHEPLLNLKNEFLATHTIYGMAGKHYVPMKVVCEHWFRINIQHQSTNHCGTFSKQELPTWRTLLLDPFGIIHYLPHIQNYFYPWLLILILIYLLDSCSLVHPLSETSVHHFL